MSGKGPDACVHGASIQNCPSCSALTDEQWVHLESTYQFRSDKRDKKARRKFEATDNPEDPIDESILDLEPGEVEETLPPDPAGPSTPAGPVGPTVG